MKFSHLYEELKLLDICKPVSPEEFERRDIDGATIKFKERLDNAKKTKLPDGTWHIHSDLHIDSCNLTTLQHLKISIVDGIFDCTDNKLTSLEGCPKKVGSIFACQYNQLTNLIGSPTEIGGSFLCAKNNLTSLEGCVISHLTGAFECGFNALTNLIGAPKTRVDSHFRCNNNRLTSLEGSPNYVGGVFDCSRNLLTGLAGAPKTIDLNLFANHNKKAFKYDDDVAGHIKLGGDFYA